MTPSTLLSAEQLHLCRHLFGGNEMAVRAVDLALLAKEMAERGEEETARHYLSTAENRSFAAFTFAKRKLEWLGGRISAKSAAGHLLNGSQPVTWRDMEVRADSNGRPYILDRDGAGPHISISHSGPLAASIAAEDAFCGIDVQEVKATVVKVRKRFSSTEERALLRNIPPHLAGPATALSLLWSAKEALRKAVPCLPLLGFQEISLTELDYHRDADVLLGRFSCRRPGVAPFQVCSLLPPGTDQACSTTLVKPAGLH